MYLSWLTWSKSVIFLLLEEYRIAFHIENRPQNRWSCNTRKDSNSGVSRSSILASLLFSIFWCNILFENENNYFANYADDSTPYVVDDNTTEILTNLSSLAQKQSTWCANNQMKANHNDIYLLVLKRAYRILIKKIEYKVLKGKTSTRNKYW